MEEFRKKAMGASPVEMRDSRSSVYLKAQAKRNMKRLGSLIRLPGELGKCEYNI